MKKANKLTVIPLGALTVLIFVLSSFPGNELPPLDFYLGDKLAHVSVFFVYGLACQLAIIGWKPAASRKKVRLYSLILGALWGVLDEVHQSFVLNRDASVYDWLADISGLALSLLFTAVIYKFVFRASRA